MCGVILVVVCVAVDTWSKSTPTCIWATPSKADVFTSINALAALVRYFLRCNMSYLWWRTKYYKEQIATNVCYTEQTWTTDPLSNTYSVTQRERECVLGGFTSNIVHLSANMTCEVRGVQTLHCFSGLDTKKRQIDIFENKINTGKSYRENLCKTVQIKSVRQTQWRWSTRLHHTITWRPGWRWQ